MYMYDTYQNAFYTELNSLLLYGNDVTVRGSTTKEYIHRSFVISEPLERILTLNGRNGNPFAQIAETLWMLAGRDDLDWLERYIPSCKKWSDDGKTWRAAYGPRLRNWDEYDGIDHVPGNVDQIAEVVKKLKSDPFTRQAIITFWDPAQDWIENSKDYPCNNWLHFMIRDGMLHLNVVVRSNDIMFGFSHADFFSWSVLQQMVAHWVGVQVGQMTWNASSWHLYDRHWKKAQNIIDSNSVRPSIYDMEYDAPFASVNFHEFDKLMHDLFTYEDEFRNGNYAYRSFRCDFLHWSAYMLMMYNYYLNELKENDSLSAMDRVVRVIRLSNMVNNMQRIDFKIGAIEFFSRHIEGFVKSMNVSNDDYKSFELLGIVNQMK